MHLHISSITWMHPYFELIQHSTIHKHEEHIRHCKHEKYKTYFKHNKHTQTWKNWNKGNAQNNQEISPLMYNSSL
jgi:hypothetical protein